MENSTILREIADFDINAPISVSISFEDDFEQTPIKTEIKTNVCQENQETVYSAFFPILQPKTEIKANTVTACKLAKELSNERTEHETLRDTSAHKPENPQNPLSMNDTARKRKTVDVYISNSKKKKHCEVSLESLSHCKVNNLTGPTTSKNEKSTTSSHDSDLPHLNTTAKQADQILNGKTLQRTDINKTNAHVYRMASLSGNMRRIMQAFGAHKRKIICKEDFIKVKLYIFKESYDTMAEMVAPVEQNSELISTFLKDTVERARMNDPYFMATYQDFANLLFEMIAWTKKQQQYTQKLLESYQQPIRNSVISEPQINKNPVQGNLQVSNWNTERDKVCISSSSPPERELSTNVTPLLKKDLQIATQNNDEGTNPLSCGTIDNDSYMIHGKMANNKKPTHQSVIQSTSPQIPNLVTNHPQQHPMLPLNSSTHSMKNMVSYKAPSQQMRDPPPLLRMQLGLDTSQSNLIEPVESQRLPPSYGPSRHFSPQTQQLMPPQPSGQSHHLQIPPHQQQVPPPYNQVPVLQSTPTQFQESQYLQTQLAPQCVQQQQIQLHCQPHLSVTEYNQIRQPQMGLSQQGPQQNKQQSHSQTTEHWPTLIELLSTEPRTPLIYANEPIHSGLSGQWQSRNQQPQVPPPPPYRADWQQGFNATFQATQISQHTQKGSPRSASTDSGFISPLNFNVSTDHTMPTIPQEPESTMPMIVHVTSLSNKASYVETGKCVVCNKSTKQMCMGCMKIYYCNFECQTIHWAAHAPNCMQPNTS